MQSPVRIRRDIPFFYDKSETEFRADIYEHYEGMVLRQSLLHLVDELWEGYPFQKILDWTIENIPQKSKMNIVDIGCSVGRLIAEIASKYPQSECYGLDYSYQMLRQAQDFWVKGKRIDFDLSKRGFGTISLEGENLANLHFGLAKAVQLPFASDSLDVVCNSFLLDRVEEPLQVIEEMYRVLKVGGRLLSITPFNFQKTKHWQNFYPFSKLKSEVQSVGFQFVKDKKEFQLKEYLDANKNAVEWNCTAFVLEKN